MKKFLALASTAAMIAVTAVSAAAPASAAPMDRQHYVMTWCGSHPGDPSCNDFNRHHRRWSDRQYRGWYQSHRHSNGFDPMAAGIFGFAAGAIASGIANSAHSSSTHVRRCEQAYRSYRPSTDTYTGYDGRTHLCRL